MVGEMILGAEDPRNRIVNGSWRYIPSDKRKKLCKRLNFWIVIVGGVVVLMGSIVSYNQHKKMETELLNKTDSIVMLGQKVANKTEKISELNERIAGIVSGGNSFCYLTPLRHRLKPNTLNFQLTHFGEYPVYDAFFILWDETKPKNADWGAVFEKHFGYKQKQRRKEDLKQYNSEENRLNHETRTETFAKEISSIQKY